MKLSELVDKVQTHGRGSGHHPQRQARRCIDQPDELESMRETLQIKANHELMKEIQAGLKALKGKSKLYTLEDLLMDNGLADGRHILKLRAPENVANYSEAPTPTSNGSCEQLSNTSSRNPKPARRSRINWWASKLSARAAANHIPYRENRRHRHRGDRTAQTIYEETFRLVKRQIGE